MTSLRDLKNRQKTTHLIKRMTGAMGMIARARYSVVLNEFQQRLAYLPPLQQLAHTLWQQANDQALPSPALCTPGPKEAPWLLVIMSSDTGLCGGFNTQVVQKAKHWLSSQADTSQPLPVLYVGKKAQRALDKDPRLVRMESHGPWIEQVRDAFYRQQIQGCHLLHSRYVNAIKQEPCITSILPLDVTPPPHSPLSKSMTNEWIAEPNLSVVLDAVMDRLFHAWGLSLEKEHRLCEHAARMHAMNTAHDNASDMLQSLQIQYNRLRQERITKEIIEIVGGAQAAPA